MLAGEGGCGEGRSVLVLRICCSLYSVRFNDTVKLKNSPRMPLSALNQNAF